MPKQPLIENDEALGERYWRELLELVALGEISPDFARRIEADMFEVRDGVRMLRPSFRLAELRQLKGDFSWDPPEPTDG
jgi:hypothetical protein